MKLDILRLSQTIGVNCTVTSDKERDRSVSGKKKEEKKQQVSRKLN
jgi:hypothetical protein